MKRKKLLFVFNPFSGKGQIKNKLLGIVDQFVKSGYEVTIYPTQKPKDAMELVEDQAGEYDLVVCSGGDGTLDETVTGMMRREKKVPIGYIPTGSTNDFAGSLNIPKSMEQAAQIAVEGEPFACDIGSFNGDYFVYIAAFGLFTDVSYETSQDLKNRIGHAAYLLEGLKRLPNIQSYHLQVTCEEKMIEDEFIYGMITNSTSAGGFKNITGKDVELDDGLFEVTLIRMPKNPIELNEIIRCLTNFINNSELIYTFKTDQLQIKSLGDISWTLDGEYGGSHREVVIQNRKQAVQIMVEKISDQNNSSDLSI
ncbi:MAG: diacylglycerol kinase family lipid kinase [Lachnospiraceae bacterium]|nr:diacylglycerol kinase family lipid kinase [Lachnospiraceae bacterium]